MVDADATWHTYQRMRSRLSARISHELGQTTGLSVADLEVLTVLSCAPGHALQALSLRCILEWEKSRLSHQLRRMAERGLIARMTCAEDGRAAMVRLTTHGQQAVADATVCHQSAVRHWFADALTVQQLAELDDISRAILARLGSPSDTRHGER